MGGVLALVYAVQLMLIGVAVSMAVFWLELQHMITHAVWIRERSDELVCSQCRCVVRPLPYAQRYRLVRRAARLVRRKPGYLEVGMGMRILVRRAYKD